MGIQEDTSSLPAISRALAKLRQDFSLGVEEFAGSLKTLTWLDLRSLLAKLGA